MRKTLKIKKRKINIGFLKLPRVCQRTSSHCGPAVLEMLAAFLKKHIDQDEFIHGAGIKKIFRHRGMNISEMGRSVKKLMPKYVFWYKHSATIDDLRKLVNRYKVPVGVEWQGVFGEYGDDDNGHYSVLTYIDPKQKILMLADPYFTFAGRDRTFRIPEFQKRWWDENEVQSPETKKHKFVKDHHTIFVIAKPSRHFPHYVGMRKYLERKH